MKLILAKTINHINTSMVGCYQIFKTDLPNSYINPKQTHHETHL